MSASKPLPADQEREPLLASQKPPSYHETLATGELATVVDVIPVTHEDASPAGGADQPLPEKKLSAWVVFWYIVLISLCTVAVGFFVKGFMDSDDVDFDLGKALFSALGGGLSGAAAMVLQVLTLM
ncbi:hypothetical protein EWM64_g10424, partial [Hericium alpestre]